MVDFVWAAVCFSVISLSYSEKFHVDLRRIFFFLQRIRGAAMVCCAHQHPHYCHLKIIPF